MPAIVQSPSPENCRPNPRAIGFVSMRRIHFLTSPSFPPSSCARRSDLLSHSLVRPVHSLGAPHPGTPPAAGVSVFQPPKSRRPSSPSSVFNRRREEGRDGKEEEKKKKEKETKADRWAHE
uniref:Uncharacterized protein n=1 Tax=Oryza meridionalis TaxID=40149 RepID=A0A0E0EPU6_9ORYZ